MFDNHKFFFDHENLWKHSNYIKINTIKRLEEDFHSRKSALKRRYSYLFSNLELPVYLTNYVGNIDINIDDKFFHSEFNYGNNFIASFSYNNIYGTQFHPEKSQTNGLIILKNFIEMNK